MTYVTYVNKVTTPPTKVPMLHVGIPTKVPMLGTCVHMYMYQQRSKVPMLGIYQQGIGRDNGIVRELIQLVAVVLYSYYCIQYLHVYT